MFHNDFGAGGWLPITFEVYSGFVSSRPSRSNQACRQLSHYRFRGIAKQVFLLSFAGIPPRYVYSLSTRLREFEEAWTYLGPAASTVRMRLGQPQTLSPGPLFLFLPGQWGSSPCILCGPRAESLDWTSLQSPKPPSLFVHKSRVCLRSSALNLGKLQHCKARSTVSSSAPKSVWSLGPTRWPSPRKSVSFRLVTPNPSPKQ